MPGYLDIGLALVCAGLVGFTIQRGGICLVGAVEDIIHKGQWRTARGIVVAVAAAAAVYALLHLTTGVELYPITLPLGAEVVVGGVLLGIGACVNGACTLGSIARFGSGQWSFAAMPVGLFIGCLTANDVLPHPWLTEPVRRAPHGADHLAPFVATAGVLALVWFVVRHRHWRPSVPLTEAVFHRRWNQAATTLVLIGLWVTLTQLVGPWAYPDLTFDLSTGHPHRVALVVSLTLATFTIAVVAGRTGRNWSPVRVRSSDLVRRLVGGFILGFGIRMLTRGNGSLTLIGLPLLVGDAIVAMLCLSVTISLIVWATRNARFSVATSRNGSPAGPGSP